MFKLVGAVDPDRHAFATTLAAKLAARIDILIPADAWDETLTSFYQIITSECEREDERRNEKRWRPDGPSRPGPHRPAA